VVYQEIIRHGEYSAIGSNKTRTGSISSTWLASVLSRNRLSERRFPDLLLAPVMKPGCTDNVQEWVKFATGGKLYSGWFTPYNISPSPSKL
jgi:hypothetical protein